MASDNVYTVLYNADSVAISSGMIVRVSANRRAVRAQADTTGHLQGLAGVNISGIVGVNGPMNVASAAAGLRVLCETGLTLAAGESLYVSATTAGRATNVAPVNAVAIGIIEDVGSYAIDQRVLAVVNTPSATTGGGGVFPGYGLDVLGPTAVGAAGTALTVKRSDQTGTAYRSDLPLSTTWFVDPVNGSDAVTNPGTTAATALRSLHSANGLKQRWWNADLQSNTTVTILGNIPSTDTGAWNFTCKPGVLVTFLGSLGATTGFGGAAIDNTLFAGGVSGFVGAANAPTADEITMTDATIPVSFTASGLMAAGVIFRRNSGGAVQHWYALKDNGAKTIRISSPMGNVGANTWGTLAAGVDGYAAYSLWTWPTQYWPSGVEGSILEDTLYHIGSALEQSHPSARRRRVWLGTGQTHRGVGFGGWVNCLLECGAGAAISGNESAQATPQLVGGACRGTGASVVSIFRDLIIGACWIGQGAQLAPNDAALVAIETQWAQHDCTIPCLAPVNGARFNFAPPVVAAGMSGTGNTSKIFSTAAAQDGTFMYNVLTGATPPFIAGVTTDANPITIGGVSYTVAQIPAVSPTRLDGTKQFPYGPTALANGGVAVALGAVGPAGTSGTVVRWVDIPDGAGGTFRIPSFL